MSADRGRDRPPPTDALRNHEAVNGFCDALTEGLDRDEVVVAGHTLVRRGDRVERRPGSFTWCRPGLLDDAVERLAWTVGVREHDSWNHAWRLGYPEALTGLAGEWTPAETVVHTVACARAPLDDATGRPRGGAVADISAVMALTLDLDVADGRRDGKPYCPDKEHGRAFWELLGPSLTIEVGRGLNALWLFDEPCRNVDAARQLGKDLHEHVRVLTEARGWDFDSPDPLLAWVRVPGTWSWRSRHLARVVDGGERWTCADLREAIPTYEHHTGSSGLGYWHGAPVPRLRRPDDWADEPTQRSTGGGGRRERGTRRGTRS